MPHFEIVSHKNIGTEDWTNVYFVSADNLSDAVTIANDIVGLEQDVHIATVNFSYVLVSEREQPFRNYRREIIDQPGGVTAPSGEKPLPLWNTMRCEFQPANSGKPDVKQLRLPLYTDQVLDISHVTTTQHDFVQAHYTAPLIALGTLEDNAGIPWVSGTTRHEIFDRQLVKRRHKKVRTP